MKKKWIIMSILFIVIAFFIFNNDEIENISINEMYNNASINIIFPKVKCSMVNDYIKKYIEKEVQDFKYNSHIYNNLYIDYDINVSNSIYDITFYVYRENDLIITNDIERININSTNNEIKTYRELTYNYDSLPDKISSNASLIAWTFDDGPSYQTNKIIDILNSYNATATFFVVGSKVKNYPKVLNKMVKMGMEIGNHTYSHKELSRLSLEQIENEINKTNEEIFNTTGVYPTLFRPSYGTINRKIKANLKYPIILWNLDTMDWRYHNSEYIKNKIINNVHDGDIILMHDTYSATTKAIEKVLPILYEMNYKVVSVSELFYLKQKEIKLGYGYGSVK